MWKWIVLGAVALIIVVGGFSLLDASSNGTVSASAVLPAISADTTGFARALERYEWQFPQDFGAHPDFQTEWWYYTGNLTGSDGQPFGFQFTVFRRSIAPEAVETDSEWRSNQLYMAHFAVTDGAGQRFFHDERFSRGGADLAGADCSDRCRLWLEDWQVTALDDTSTQTRIQADAGTFALDLVLDQIKPPALQGDNGLSAKSAEPGNASYYYSLTRMPAEGTIRIGDETFTVTGMAWKDHEFSTSALGSNALGWDWFGLQLDDNRELMLGQIRLQDGGRDPFFGGILVEADGSTQFLPSEAFTITTLGNWTSPHSGAVYPAGWAFSVTLEDGLILNFTAQPLIPDQELHGGGIAYWEGAVTLAGDVTGRGYAELTGYADSMTGRF